MPLIKTDDKSILTIGYFQYHHYYLNGLALLNKLYHAEHIICKPIKTHIDSTTHNLTHYSAFVIYLGA
jgi:hypothetical protein